MGVVNQYTPSFVPALGLFVVIVSSAGGAFACGNDCLRNFALHHLAESPMNTSSGVCDNRCLRTFYLQEMINTDQEKTVSAPENRAATRSSAGRSAVVNHQARTTGQSTGPVSKWQSPFKYQ